MYIYFDTNGTIKEIVNDKSIRNGSNEANKIYCYLEGEPEIDDIWYLQKLPSGELSNEVSFKNSTITKAIPYDAKRDMKYFKDFEQYTFYVFTLNTFLTSQKGLNIATIRVSVDNTIWALGELTFNVQENVINVDNGITQSQYDYLLLAYASRTLSEQTGRNLNDLIDDKLNAKIGDLASGSPKVFDTEYNIEHMQDDEGIAVATDTGYIYVFNDTQRQYVNTGLLYVGDISLYYTKTESDNKYAQLGANNTFTGDNDFRGDSLFSDDINQAFGDFSTQGNVEAQSFTKNGTDLDDIYASKSNTYTKDETDTLLNAKADKTDTYTKSEVNTALNLKADKSTTYTKTETDNLLSAKADKTTVNGIDNRVGALENEITDLQSVQNVVDVVATKSALNSYNTSKLEENDKIQVIADETHSGASTIYNWNGSAWEYIGAYGTNSYTKTETLEQIDLHKLVNKTYSELATLKSGNNLVAGQLYRITDYVTKINGKCNGIDNDARSVEHPFDIIVRAISNNKFSEEARAIQHTGDTYFANCDLKVWQLWYCFENDSVRFEWADTLTGKGVIYRMIDEFGNDLPYDFKNIQFKRYKITATTDARHSNAVGKYLGFSGNYNCTSDSTDYQWYFTFSKRADGTDLSLTETTAPSYTNCYYVKEVKIGEYLSDTPNYRGIQALNNIVFECDNIVVDVQMGVCSNHNTFIGNKDITYVYFKEMCRNNIVYGEMSHARADECFEQNIMGDFVALSQYTLCWNKFSHHFARNIAVQMQSNDFEAQVSDCKFPENFTRNHIFNMWGSVDASTHDTFNRCELGLFSYTTLSGGGTWDGVYGISLDHCTIKIANLFGSKLGRMEYVSISEGVNNYSISNLTVGALFGSSSKVLTIALTDLASYQIASVYEKKIDFANETVNNLRMLIYTWASFSVSRNIIDYGAVRGTISSVDGTVTWSAMNTLGDKLDDIESAFNTKMLKSNPTGTGSISMNDGTASGTNSYANGSGATASGNFSRAKGFGATASGDYSTAVGGTASGSSSIAYGNTANASGDSSIAFGDYSKAKGNNQVVTGKFNIPDTSSLEIVGNGAYMNTSNARLLDANGNEYLKGDIYVNSTFTKDGNGDLSAKNGTKITDYVDNAINDLRWELGSHTLDVESDTDVAFSKSVPSGAIGCQINKVGGMSYKSENLLNIADETGTTFGVNYTFSNGAISISGTATNATFINVCSLSLTAGTYYFKSFGATGSNSTYFSYVQILNDGVQAYSYQNGSFTLTETTTVQILVAVRNGVTVDLTFKDMLVKGSTAPSEFKPYGILNSAVTSVVSKGANLLQLNNVAETTTNGVTYKVENGIITFNGTATSTTYVNINLASELLSNTYLTGVFIENAQSCNIYFMATNTDYSTQLVITSNITEKNKTKTGSIYRIMFTISPGVTINNMVVKPFVVLGTTAPTEFKAYRGTVDTITILTAIQNLTGYGWGINDTCYNYIDFERKVFVQKVGRVDLGTLTWTKYTITEGTMFRGEINDIATLTNGTIVANVLCANYLTVSATTRADGTCYVQSNQSAIDIIDSNYNDVATFKTAMSGVYLYYELATPVEIDISSYITDDDKYIDVEPNGTLEFTNTYSQDVPSDIDYLIEEVKA